MLIKIDVDSDLYHEIEKLVQEGKYEDIYQFIKIAIQNQIQEEQATISESNIPESSLPLKIKQETEIIQRQVLRMLSDIPLEQSQIPPPITPLIWSFYNRFFPVKVVIRKLATMITTQKTWIELTEVQEETFAFAENIASNLKEYEEENQLARNQKLSTGLPTPRSELRGLKGYQKQKKESKLLSSKLRFIEQFVGKHVKKDPPDFKGACFEMDLMGVKFVGTNCLVSLTENGKKFALMENPILDEDRFDSAFSDEESKFILNNIIPKFRLESIIVSRILDELKSESLTSDQIEQIFKEEKNRHYNNVQLSKLEKMKLEDSINSERVATMGRLSELGLVKWSINNEGKSIYSLPKK